MKDRYTIEQYIEWADNWMPIAIDFHYKPKQFATKREALDAIDREARKYSGYHKYRVMKNGRDVAYKSVTTGVRA